VPRYHHQRTCAGIQEIKEILMEPTMFSCSICGEGSRDICVFCTKDACTNHLCERCRRCSDCCECEVPLTRREQRAEVQHRPATSAEPAVVPDEVEQLTPG
jgi:hypothetical protein